MTLSDGMTAVEEGAFSLYRNLETLTIGKDIVSIAKRELNECRLLSSISVSDENPNFQSIDGVLFTNAEYFTLVQYPPHKQDTLYELPEKVIGISEGAFADCANLKTVKFCGKFNDYKDAEVVTGSSAFSAVVSSAFENDTFYGQPLAKDLTAEECPRETTAAAPSSAKANVGLIVGCACGTVVLFVLIAGAVWLRVSSNAKRESIELEEKVSQALNGTLSTVFFDENYVRRYKVSTSTRETQRHG